MKSLDVFVLQYILYLEERGSVDMVKTVKLKCGTTLIMDKTDYVQSAALGIWVKNRRRR